MSDATASPASAGQDHHEEPKPGEVRLINGIPHRFIERELEGDKWEVVGPPEEHEAKALDVAEMMGVVERATPGPWIFTEVVRPQRIGDAYSDYGWTTEFVGYEILGSEDTIVHSATDGFEGEEDVEFAVTFDPPTVKALLARISAIEAERDEALDRVAELETDAEIVSAEFEKATRNIRTALQRMGGA